MTIHDAYEFRSELTKQQRYDARRRASGRCMVCGKFAVNARHCERHRDRLNERRRELYAQTRGKRL